jgi:membrane protein
MVKDSPRAVIYSSVLSVIVFMALWLYGKSIPVDVLVLFPVIIFSVELLSCSLPTPMDIIDLLANSSFPREEDMDEWQRVDVRPTKDMKNKSLRRTAVFVIICLISVGLTSTLLGILKSFAGPLGYILEALGLYILMLACISIYWYKTGQYWITDKVSKVLTAIGCATVIFYVLVIFLRFGLFFLIANKEVFIVKVLSTIDMINFYFSPIVIFLVVLIYSSWAMLSYHKKSTSNIEKK